VPDHLGYRLPRRLIQLYVGLVTFAFGEALIVQARLGVMSWDVLHQGLTKHFGLSIGQWSIIVGALVLLLWIPMREKPGVGTVSNVLVIGASLDLFLRWVPAPTSLGWRVAWLLLGIFINGVATAAYIGARLGPGPRDGLMTGLVRLSRRPVGWIRTGIEGVGRGLRLPAGRQPGRRDGAVRSHHRTDRARLLAQADRRRTRRRPLKALGRSSARDPTFKQAKVAV